MIKNLFTKQTVNNDEIVKDLMEQLTKAKAEIVELRTQICDLANANVEIANLNAKVKELQETNKSAMQHALDIAASQGIPTSHVIADYDGGEYKRIVTQTNGKKHPGVSIQQKF
jgi:methylthioribose-1-phosphate isomerase